MSLNIQETDKIIKDLIENKILKLVSSEKIIDVVADSLNNPFNFSFGLEHLIYSSYTRSFSSSLGTNMQGSIVEIAKAHGWEIINDGENDKNIKIEGYYSDETRKIINEAMDYINNTSSKDPITKDKIDDFKIKIIDSVLMTRGKKRSLNSDLVIKKNNIINVIELKAGGDLDKGKAKSQRNEIFEIYALVASKFKDELRSKDLNIDTYFATMYNKDAISKGVEGWKATSVKKNFLKEELLIGKDLWNFICEDEFAYEKIMEIFFSYSSVVEEQIKKMCQEIKPKLLEKIDKIENEKIKELYLNKI